MITEAQLQYLEEVLGMSPQGLVQARPAAPAVQLFALQASLEEEELLAKILASIQLKDLSRSSEPMSPHVIAFEGPTGRQEKNEQVWWVLPRLHEMLGASPEVGQKKKEAWVLLQQLKRELNQ